MRTRIGIKINGEVTWRPKKGSATCSLALQFEGFSGDAGFNHPGGRNEENLRRQEAMDAGTKLGVW